MGDTKTLVVVKPLEWIDTIPERSEVKSIVGLFFAYADGRWTSPITGHHFDTGTLNEAKVAAQADYEARIRSAIATPAADELRDLRQSIMACRTLDDLRSVQITIQRIEGE